MGLAVAIVILIVISLLYASTRHEAMLFYYGAAVEVPDGTALAIMNPFRDKASEQTAARLIRDLKTSRCQTIVRDFNGDPGICPIMQNTHRVSLVWRKDGDFSRVLVYDLVGRRNRLWITFSREESGFGVSAISVIR